MKTILPWLHLIVLSPFILLGGLFFVAICAICGTSERVPVTYLPGPMTLVSTYRYRPEMPKNWVQNTWDD